MRALGTILFPALPTKVRIDAMTTPEFPESDRTPSFLNTTVLVCTAFFFAAWPPMAAIVKGGVQGAFKYFASDSFYYLAIAHHSESIGRLSFDGTHPTNAFHPLWTIYLHSVKSALGLDQEQMILFAAISSLFLAALGTALFSWAVYHMTNRFAVALLASVPGLFYLIMPHFGKDFAAQWNFANSMESPLSVFFFGWLLLFMITGSRRQSGLSKRDLLLASILVAGLVTSRLDDVFILVPFGLYALYSGSSTQDRIARAAYCLAVPVAILTTYMTFNYIYSGQFLPSSGLAKFQPGLALLRNGYATYTTLFPLLDFMRPLDSGVWKSEGWRVVQMLAPMILSAYWLYRLRDSSKVSLPTLPTSDGQKTVVACLASYVLLKGAYNFAVVGLWGQGNWYYVVSIMTCNLILALLVSEMLDRARRTEQSAKQASWLCRHEHWISGTAAIVLVAVIANSTIYEKANGKQHSRNFQFWSQRARAVAMIDRHCGDCGVISFDDGIVAFSLEDVPTMNGIGLALDEEARLAQNEGRLLDLAWQRGHRLLVTVNYPMAPNAYRRNEALSAHIRRNAHLKGQSVDDWNFELAFEVPGSNVNFVSFSPGPSGF